jgi:hypothetical protein
MVSFSLSQFGLDATDTYKIIVTTYAPKATGKYHLTVYSGATF